MAAKLPNLEPNERPPPVKFQVRPLIFPPTNSPLENKSIPLLQPKTINHGSTTEGIHVHVLFNTYVTNILSIWKQVCMKKCPKMELHGNISAERKLLNKHSYISQ